LCSPFLIVFALPNCVRPSILILQPLDIPSFPMYNKHMKTPSTPNSAQDYLKGGLALLILATLRDGPAHGYALARTIERRTENALQLREGTLYPALHTLERDGLIESAWETPANGRERKTYTLTDSGTKKLSEWTGGWQQFVVAVGRVLVPESDQTVLPSGA